MVNEQEFQLHLVLSAIIEGTNSIEKIASQCGGLYPLELVELIDELIKQGKVKRVDNYYYPTLIREKRKTLRIASGSYKHSIELPIPHPHDYDWRFTPSSSQQLAKLVLEKTPIDGKILLLGTPSVFSELINFTEVPSTILVDWNKEVITYLSQLSLPDWFTLVSYDLLSGNLWKCSKVVDTILFDPPWYPEYYISFLVQAAYNTRIGATVIAIFLPINTRPNAIIERWEIFKIAEELGFHVQSIEPCTVNYKTPEFELKSLRSFGLEIQEDWRVGDTVIFRKVRHVQQEVIEKIISSLSLTKEISKWGSVLFGSRKIKLRKPFDDHYQQPELISIERENILPTVSRRYKGRQKIDLWFWDNRVFAVKGKVAFWAALNVLAGNPIPDECLSTPETYINHAIILLKREIETKGYVEQNTFINDDLLNVVIIMLREISNKELINIDILERICFKLKIRGHLAILNQPYLDKIITGDKTIESRFSKNRVAPFQKVGTDDLLFLKETSGPIIAIASISEVRFFGSLKPDEVEEIMGKYSKGLALEETFKTAKQESKYGTLIFIKHVISIDHLFIDKTDRRAWIVLNDEIQRTLF